MRIFPHPTVKSVLVPRKVRHATNVPSVRTIVARDARKVTKTVARTAHR